jgi:opacity protein-like surface antigen
LADFSPTASPNVKGWVGGGQLGYNWLNGSWLYGLEADIQATGQRASLNGGATVFRAPVGDGIGTIVQNETNSWKLPWFATFRGRLGVTLDQSWLFYATGGLAVGHEKFSNTTSLTVATTVPAASATATVSSSEGTTRVGFAVGAGVEKAIDAHWRVKADISMSTSARTPSWPAPASIPTSRCTTTSCASGSTIASRRIRPSSGRIESWASSMAGLVPAIYVFAAKDRRMG